MERCLLRSLRRIEPLVRLLEPEMSLSPLRLTGRSRHWGQKRHGQSRPHLRQQGCVHAHGIDAGDGTVIHFTGEPGAAKINAAIERTPMEEFLKGGELKIRRYGRRDDADTTMTRAESRIGNSDYHLVVNDCEHFATGCCTGRNSSEQVRGAGSLTANGAVAGTTVAATTGVVGAMGAVSGLSGAGIMSGLATAGGVVGGGAAIGTDMIGLGPAVVSVGITQVALRDDESLPDQERRARRDGRQHPSSARGRAP